MKGLLLKDFYVTIKDLKIYLFIALFFIGAAVIDRSNIFFLYFLSMISGMFPQTLLSLDEKSRWTEYSLVLPYSQNQIISSKYVIGIVLPAVMSALSSLILCFMGYSFGEIFLFFVTASSMSIIIPAVCLPFSFKFGVEKGRIAYYIIMALVAFSYAFFGGNAAEGSGHNLTAVPTNIILVIAIAAIVLYVLSWLLSIRIVNTRR